MRFLISIFAASALAFAPQPAQAESALDTAYWLLLNDYGMVMSKAEFCDLSTRFGLKNDVLSALGAAGGIDLMRVELDLEKAYQAERDRLPHECKPDDVRLWGDSFARSIDNVAMLIRNGGEYPDQQKSVAVAQPMPEPAPLVASVSSVAANPELIGTKIFYGSRAGMSVTIDAASGIDTAAAVIEATMTKEDATSFCAEYIGKVTDECIAGQLEGELAPSISANCPNGVFQDFGGNWHQFMGPMNAVRRQNIWLKLGGGFAECRARLLVDVMRRSCGAASADVRWFVA